MRRGSRCAMVAFAAVAAACGGQTTSIETMWPAPAPLFDYAPDRVIKRAGSFYEETTTYSYDAHRRLASTSHTNRMPETPRTVQTLHYGAKDRLERVVTEIYWGADPSQRTTDLRHYDEAGRLAGWESHGENVGRTEPITVRSASIERDAAGRMVKIVEDGKTTFEFGYDQMTGHVASVTEPNIQMRTPTFDDVGRLDWELRTFFGEPESGVSSTAYHYDAEGFVSHTCTTAIVMGDCFREMADVTFEHTRSDNGEPLQLSSRPRETAQPMDETVVYTSAGTSAGLQQLYEVSPVFDFVLDIYGRGEIDRQAER